jgi:hypothetical protein
VKANVAPKTSLLASLGEKAANKHNHQQARKQNRAVYHAAAFSDTLVSRFANEDKDLTSDWRTAHMTLASKKSAKPGQLDAQQPFPSQSA